MPRGAFLLLVIAVLVVTSPAISIATQQTQNQCAAYQTQTQTKSTAAANLKTVLSCADRCVDEEVTIEKGVIKYKAVGTNKAETNAQGQKTGRCTPRACGQVTITPPAGKKFTISKCDKRLIDATDELNKGADPGKIVNNLAFQDITKSAINSSTPNSQLSGILQSFGVSQADADAAVVNDKDKVVDLLQKAASGDTAGAQAAAKELQLNENLFNDVAKLTPADRAEKFASVLSDDQKRFITENNTTGFQGASPLQIDAYGQPQRPVDRNNRIDPKLLGEIAANAQRKVCENVSRCFVTREAQFATLINESSGNVRVYGDDGKSTSIAQVYRPTAELLANRYREIYGEEYVLHKIDIRDPRLNPEWIANQSMQMQAVVLQAKGEAVGGDYQRQLTAYNGSGPKAAAYAVRALNNTYQLQSGSAFGYWQTAYNAAGDSAANGPVIQNVNQVVPTGNVRSPSPFAQVNPFQNVFQNQNTSQQQYVPSFAGPYTVGNPYQAPVQNPAYQQPYSYVYNPQTGQYELQQNTAASQQLPTVASLVIQPSRVAAGQSALLSWSSIGVPSGSACELKKLSPAPSVVLFRGNEGSITINTTATTSPGTIQFELRCPSSASPGYTDRTASLIVSE